MANDIRISDLPSISEANAGNVLAISSGVTTYKIAIDDILGNLKTNIIPRDTATMSLGDSSRRLLDAHFEGSVNVYSYPSDSFNVVTVQYATDREQILSNYIDNAASNLQTQVDAKENNLGVSSHDGYILSTTTQGVRSWVKNVDSFNEILGDPYENDNLADALNNKYDALDVPSEDGVYVMTIQNGVRTWIDSDELHSDTFNALSNNFPVEYSLTTDLTQTFTHNKSRRVNWRIVDEIGREVEADVREINENQLIVNFVGVQYGSIIIF